MVAKCFQTWSKIARIFAKKYIVHGAVTAAAEAVKTLVGFWLHIDYVLGTPKYEKWLGNFPTNTTILEISTIVVLGIAWATIHIVLANSKKNILTEWLSRRKISGLASKWMSVPVLLVHLMYAPLSI